MRRPRLSEVERRAAAHEAYQQQVEQEAEAQVAEVVNEFGGPDNAVATMTRMATELLYCRKVMSTLIEVTDLIQAERPFIIMPGGPHWTPPDRRRWWFR